MREVSKMSHQELGELEHASTSDVWSYARASTTSTSATSPSVSGDTSSAARRQLQRRASAQPAALPFSLFAPRSVSAIRTRRTPSRSGSRAKANVRPG